MIKTAYLATYREQPLDVVTDQKGLEDSIQAILSAGFEPREMRAIEGYNGEMRLLVLGKGEDTVVFIAEDV